MIKIGYFDADIVIPEEILMAANLAPIRLLGNPTIPIDKANEHVPPTHCVWARNVLEQALQGLDKDIKGLITAHGCDCTNREFDIWLEYVNLDFMFYLNVPIKRNGTALKFFIEDIKELITQIEDHFKVKITNEKISEAIKITNKIRKSLRELSEYRSKMILKGSEFHALVKMAQTIEKKEVLPKLESKLNEIINRGSFEENNYKRILLTGSVIDDTEFLKFLESIGLQVVIDDLCIGTRYYWDLIEENGDPLHAIAKYHLDKPLYSTKIPSQSRFNFLKKLAAQYNIDGVINIAQKFCEVILYDNPFMTKKFKELEIPYIFVELEYNRESYKQLSTRFEAFKEML